MRQTVQRPESRYLVLALFTIAMAAASLVAGAIGTLAPLFRVALAVDKTQLGLVISALMLGSTLLTAAAGLATDRFGDKKVLLWSGLAGGIALILAAALQQFWWLVLWIFVYGICFAAVTPAGSHAIIFFFDRTARGLAMGIRQAGYPLGGFIGAVAFAEFSDHGGYRPALVFAGLTSIVVTWVAALGYREPSALRGESRSLRQLFAEIVQFAAEPALLLVTLTSIILMGLQLALVGFLPLTLVQQAGHDAELAAQIFAISQIAAIAGRLTWGRVSDRVFGGQRLPPLAIVAGLAAFAAYAFADAAHLGVGALIALGALLGFAAQGWFGLSVVAMSEIGGEQGAGGALGFGLTLTLLSGCITPAVFGLLADRYGFPFAWHTFAIIGLAGIPCALVAGRVLRALPSTR